MDNNLQYVIGGKTKRIDVGYGIIFIIKSVVSYGEKAQIADFLYANKKEDEENVVGNFIRMRGDVCKLIIVGWEGVTSEKGETIPWDVKYIDQLTDEMCEKILEAYAEAQTEDKKKEGEVGAGDNPVSHSEEPATTADSATPVSE